MVGDILVVAEANSPQRPHSGNDGPVSLSLERHELQPDPGPTGHRLDPAGPVGRATGSPRSPSSRFTPTQPTIGLPDWTINLENSSGTVIASTTTDAQGNYSFTNVASRHVHRRRGSRIRLDRSSPRRAEPTASP